MNKYFIQTRNPKTDRFVKIDVRNARIISHKKSPGPYKNVRQKGDKDE